MPEPLSVAIQRRFRSPVFTYGPAGATISRLGGGTSTANERGWGAMFPAASPPPRPAPPAPPPRPPRDVAGPGRQVPVPRRRQDLQGLGGRVVVERNDDPRLVPGAVD